MTRTRMSRSHLVAGLAGAAVTVGIIAAATLGYDAWQSEGESDPTMFPSSSSAESELPEPVAAEDDPRLTDDPLGDPKWSVEPSCDWGDTESDKPGQQNCGFDLDGRPDDKQHNDDEKSRNDEDDGASRNAQQDPEVQAWRTVLDGFAHDFNKATGSKQRWQARMARWVTPHLAKAYKTVDPRMLPNATIDRTEIQSQGSEAVTAVIHYHGIRPVWVHLQPTPDGWRITQAEPAEQQ